MFSFLFTCAFSGIKDKMVDGEAAVAGLALQHESEVRVRVDAHLKNIFSHIAYIQLSIKNE